MDKSAKQKEKKKKTLWVEKMIFMDLSKPGWNLTSNLHALDSNSIKICSDPAVNAVNHFEY